MLRDHFFDEVIMKLTDTKVREAKPRAGHYKLFDGRGLFILVKNNGTKSWRYKYRVNGKEKSLSLGLYPNVSLKDARKKHQEARRQVEDGSDPSAIRRETKLSKQATAANTFGAIWEEWRDVRLCSKASATIKRNTSIVTNHLLPSLKSRPVSDIGPVELLAVLRKLEDVGTLETAKKARSIAGQIFRYAIAIGKADRDPSADLRDALRSAPVKHYPAVTSPEALGQLLVDIDNYSGTERVKSAIWLSLFLLQRPGNIAGMMWEDIQADRWVIPASKMKTREDLIVPLATHSLKILETLRPVTGNGKYVFSSANRPSVPLSNGAITRALNSMGYKDIQTPHGFRATSRTILDEILGLRVELVEMQLGHKVRDVHGRAYNRTQHMLERIKIMQRWADYLIELREQAAEQKTEAWSSKSAR